MVNKKTKDDLFAAQGLLATGSEANRPYQKDGRMLVRTSPPGGKATYRVLADATGKLTAAGRHWEDEFGDGEPLLTTGVKGQTFNEQQPVTQRGASEYQTSKRKGSCREKLGWSKIHLHGARSKVLSKAAKGMDR